MVEKIEALGAECWLDEKDLAGGDVEALILVSPNSVKSKWVPFEIGGLRQLEKHVTPIFNNVKAQQMEPLKDIKGVDLNNFEQFLAQLKRRISDARVRKQ